MSEYGVMTEARTVRFERVLPGTIERVWSYLTDSDKRGVWLASGEMELFPGGRVELIFRNNELTGGDDRPSPKYAALGDEIRMLGRITVCEPPRRLAFTWSESSGGDSEVSFELSPRGDTVQLVLTHRRLATRDDMISVAGGWHTHLDLLADRLAGRSPGAFWAKHTRLEAEYERVIAAD